MSYAYQVTTFDQYKSAYKKSVEDPEGFWSDVAEHFKWQKKWDKVLEWDFKNRPSSGLSGAS